MTRLEKVVHEVAGRIHASGVSQEQAFDLTTLLILAQLIRAIILLYARCPQKVDLANPNRLARRLLAGWVQRECRKYHRTQLQETILAALYEQGKTTNQEQLLHLCRELT